MSSFVAKTAINPNGGHRRVSITPQPLSRGERTHREEDKHMNKSCLSLTSVTSPSSLMHFQTSILNTLWVVKKTVFVYVQNNICIRFSPISANLREDSRLTKKWFWNGNNGGFWPMVVISSFLKNLNDWKNPTATNKKVRAMKSSGSMNASKAVLMINDEGSYIKMNKIHKWSRLVGASFHRSEQRRPGMMIEATSCDKPLGSHRSCHQTQLWLSSTSTWINNNTTDSLWCLLTCLLHKGSFPLILAPTTDRYGQQLLVQYKTAQ